ncbi:hypothetical protein SH467x_000590 [Pirellulaceae bacterium SH467]
MQDGTEIRVSVKTVSIDLPLVVGEMPGYKSKNVSLKFDPNQLDALYRIFHGLNLRHATLRNGKTVATPYHGIQWLLEQIGEHDLQEKFNSRANSARRSAATEEIDF